MCALFLSTGTITCRVVGTKRYSRDLPQGGLEILCKLTFSGASSKIEKVKKVLLAVRSGKESVIGEESDQQSKKRKIDEEESTVGTTMEWLTVGQSRRIIVSMAEKQQLLQNEMLNDVHINACQVLLQNQFPHISGLCSTLQITMFSSGEWVGNYIQVIHCRGNHWITATTIGCRCNEAAVYDSLYTDVDSATHQSIRQVLQCPSISLKIPPVGKQTGVVDCGLFAIAFATHLVYGRDPSELLIIKFDQLQMHNHFLTSLEQKFMREFPTV